MSFAAARQTLANLTKRPCIGNAPEESSDSQGGASGAGAASGGSSSQAQSTAAPQSFIQAARAGNKCSTPAPPTFPRPQLVRGDHIFKHADYDSMERPAPKSASPTVLYVDMQQSSLSPDEVLDAAYTEVGGDAVGFQVFVVQKTLALVSRTPRTRRRTVTAPSGRLASSCTPPRLKPRSSSSSPSKAFLFTTSLLSKML